MRVAIAGAGLAGLGLAWHLLQRPSVSVTLFDPKGIGGGASGVSTGLLHPFPGRLALKSWRADEGMSSTLSLLTKVEEEIGRPAAHRSGILRLALTGQQQHDFPQCTKFGCQWWSAEKVVDYLPEATPAPALWIPQGLTIYAMSYLQGLWQLCAKKGAELRLEALPDTPPFDRIILATGFETPQKLSLPLSYSITRGQSLLCQWSKPTPCTLLSQGHLTHTDNPNHCLLGSTYENPATPQDPQTALALQSKIAAFYPPASHFTPLQIRSGCRISIQNGYRPIVTQVDTKTWAFFGLGSRGLLYHSLLAESLAAQIV